jgi:hypothetical protein
MPKGIRIRLMIAAVLFALAWALGVEVRSITYTWFTLSCLVIGSMALTYFVWEYHRASRRHPLGPGSPVFAGLRNWPGTNVYGLPIRPEYITAALAFLICMFGIYEYLQISSPLSSPTPTTPPLVILPESRPFQ